MSDVNKNRDRQQPDGRGSKKSEKFNPTSKEGILRLRKAMNHAQKKMLPFRDNRKLFVEDYVGARYSESMFDGARRNEGHSGKRMPYNLLELQVNIFMQNLVASRPRSLVQTQHPELKATAFTLKLAIDHIVKEINLEDTLKGIVKDSMFGLGIVKIGLDTKARVEIGGYLHNVGQPFVDRVDFEDFICDMNALKWEEVSFIGNRYRRTLDYVKNSGNFTNTENLTATSKHQSITTNADGDERITSISRGFNVQGDADEYKPFIELWDLWIPEENIIITIADDQESDALLSKIDWEGPENGPYRLLSYEDVPHQLMPLAPAAVTYDLNRAANNIMRKLENQARRAKTVNLYSGADAKDAENIKNASDGDMIRSDNPAAVKEVTYGGPDQNILGFLLQLENFHNRSSGNLDSLGGLGVQSETFSQDRLIAASANKRMQGMTTRVTGFVRNIMQDLAFYLWNDPLIEIPLVKRSPNGEAEIPITFTPEERENDFIEYNIDIQPFSMQEETPAIKLQKLQNFLGIAFPMLPLMQEQGMSLDVEALFRNFAELSNVQNIEDLLIFQDGPQRGSPTPIITPGANTPNTNNLTVRENRATGGTREANNQTLAQILQGASPQQSEVERAIRR